MLYYIVNLAYRINACSHNSCNSSAYSFYEKCSYSIFSFKTDLVPCNSCNPGRIKNLINFSFFAADINNDGKKRVDA